VNKSAQKWELAVQAALQQHMDRLVRAANADATLLEGSKMKENQIRNVLNVARETPSLAVVTNFIRYQLGRSQTGPNWQHGGFGIQVIEQIESPTGIIHRQADKVLETLRSHHPDLPDDIADKVRYELMCRYLGYLNRAFVYGSKVENAWQDLRRPAQSQEA
jgi:hypothetical protein